jgi:protein O-mannosyl-transferase
MKSSQKRIENCKSKIFNLQFSIPPSVLAICGLLLLAVIVIYGQTATHDFVYFDDPEYVSDNKHVMEGLTGAGIVWAFTQNEVSAQWYPCTMLSLMADVQMVKPREGPPNLAKLAGRMHVTNLLLHAANSLILFLLLRAMTGSVWRSACVAALFAIHPLHVESVAWITERKDVLSGLFGLLALWAYVGYARRPSVARYLLVFTALAAGLMSKPILVTWPFLLLLLDYWPLRRQGAGSRRDLRWLILEKIPLLALAAASASVTFLAQRSGGAVVTLETVSLFERIARATVLYVGYLGKTFWPVNLCPVYIEDPLGSNWSALGAAVLLALLTAAAAWAARRGQPWWIVGWFWFLGTLVPTIGLVQAGLQVRADRFLYLPQIGILIALTWAVGRKQGAGSHPEGTRQGGKQVTFFLPAPSRVPSGWLPALLFSLTLSALAVRSWQQTHCWRDSVTLWSQSLAVTPKNVVALHNLAEFLGQNRHDVDAIAKFRLALKADPSFAETHYALASLLARCGQFDESIAEYRIALQINSGYTAAETGLGEALFARGNYAEAADHFRAAMKLEPRNANICNNLGKSLLSLGQFPEAAAAFQQALKIDPNSAPVWNNFAGLLSKVGRLPAAVAGYRRAIEINPGFAEAHKNLALVLDTLGQRAEAVEHFRKALTINPNFVEAHNSFGALLMEQGEVPEAIDHFRRAIAINPKFDLPHANLGQALSRQRQYAAAANEFRTFLRFQPNHAVVLGWLAWLLATAPEDAVRNGKEAVALAEKAAAQGSPESLDALAAAYAECRRFPEAVETARKAKKAAEDGKNQSLAAAIDARLKLYEAGKPYRNDQ